MPDPVSPRTGLFDPGPGLPQPEPSPDGPRPASPATLLLHGGPREVLARIVPGDPLGVRALVRRALRSAALLLDADAVQLRALARIAREAPLWRGRPELDTWLAQRVDEALHDLRAEERSGEAPPWLVLDELAARLDLDPGSLRAGLAAFHRLARLDREAFHLAVLEARGLDDTARRLESSFVETAHAVRRALLALGLVPGAAPPGVASRRAAPRAAAHPPEEPAPR